MAGVKLSVSTLSIQVFQIQKPILPSPPEIFFPHGMSRFLHEDIASYKPLSPLICQDCVCLNMARGAADQQQRNRAGQRPLTQELAMRH